MTEATTTDIETVQRAVAQRLGQCLLRLQAYERLMKAIAADFEVSGSLKSGPEKSDKRKAAIARKTLGTLVGEVLGSFLTSADRLNAIDGSSEPSSEPASFAFRMQIAFPAEEFMRVERELSEFVHLRNELVHHFAERHDLTNYAGCQFAEQTLILAAERIERHYADLWGWGEDLVRGKNMMAEVMQDPAVRDSIIDASPSEARLKS